MTIEKNCICDLFEMRPVYKLKFNKKFVRQWVCETCGFGVTPAAFDAYNEYHGLSGYDEQYDDLDDEKIGDEG